MTRNLAAWVSRRLAAEEPVILVTVEQARGSTPREAGTVMAVSAGETAGTIGGGRLEYDAIARAREMIGEGRDFDRLDLPLGPAVGQCCGGHVLLSLARADAAALARLEDDEARAAAGDPQVIVFGAGHVGQSLIAALRPLPLRLVWCDARSELFPEDTGVPIETGDPLAVVEAAEPGAAVFVMTHSHALDYAITEAALKRDDLAYVGLIGSRTKARRFERWFVARGNDARRLDDLVCPIGDYGTLDKRPAVIAALAVAEVLTALADHRSETQNESLAGTRGGLVR
ncbi:xanthine dehydrogenase accessory protein XdhC [Pelagibius sp.]|uniref:xanthine dehydrogenase accessory protein XdhC n=1 Tax=Pelagibius sp. TaxID=1931238 RepID=UPI002636EA3E|nr:xanthine dehydrogenase accessory protein XdhC [Pelagibius sp.]